MRGLVCGSEQVGALWEGWLLVLLCAGNADFVYTTSFSFQPSRQALLSPSETLGGLNNL